MQRRQLSAFYALLFVPLVIAGPGLFYRYCPHAAFLLFHLYFLAVIFGLYLFWKFSRTTLETQVLPALPLPWVAQIILLQMAFLVLFLNGIFYLRDFYLHLNILASENQGLWLYQAVRYLLVNPGFFPWSFLAASILIFAKMYHRYPWVPAPLTHFLHLKRNHHWKRLTQVMVDFYPSLAARWVLVTGWVFFLLQLFNLYFRENSPFRFMLVSSIVCAGLLIMLQNRRSLTRLNRLDQAGIPMVLPLLICLACIIFVVWAVTFLCLHFELYALPAVASTHPHLKITPWGGRVWTLSTWILMTPLYASLMSEISSGRKLRDLVLWQFAFPVGLVCLWLILPSSWIIAALQNHSLPWVLCFLSGLVLIGLSSLKSAHRIFWVGYYAAMPEKKPRQAKTILLVQFIILLMGLLTVAGPSGWLNFSYSLAVGLLFIWLCAACK